MDTKNKVQHSEQDARLEQDIVNAVRGRGLKEAMQQWDNEERLQKIRRNYRIKIAITSLLSPIAVAAVFAGVIFLGPRTWRYQIYKQGNVIARYFFHSSTPKKSTAKPIDEAAQARFYATAAPSIQGIGERYLAFAPSGGNSLILEAVAEMEQAHYDVALNNLSDALEESDNNQTIEDDIHYLEAICWYMSGKTKKATKRLQEIANSESVHKMDAQKLLQKVN